MDMRKRLFLTTSAIVIGGGCLISWKVYESRKTDAIVNTLANMQEHPIDGIKLSWNEMARSGDKIILKGVHADVGGMPIDANDAVISASRSTVDILLEKTTIKTPSGNTEIAKISIMHIPSQNPNPGKDPLITLHNLEGVHVRFEGISSAMKNSGRMGGVAGIGSIDIEVKSGKVSNDIRNIIYSSSEFPEQNMTMDSFVMKELDVQGLILVQQQGPAAMRNRAQMLSSLSMSNIRSSMLNITNIRMEVTGHKHGHFEVTGISVQGQGAQAAASMGLPPLDNMSIVSDTTLKNDTVHVDTRISAPKLANIKHGIDIIGANDPVAQPKISRMDIRVEDLGGLGALIQRQAQSQNMNRQVMGEGIRRVAAGYIAVAGMEDKIGFADRIAEFVVGHSTELKAGFEMKSGKALDVLSMKPPSLSDVVITEAHF